MTILPVTFIVPRWRRIRCIKVARRRAEFKGTDGRRTLMPVRAPLILGNGGIPGARMDRDAAASDGKCICRTAIGSHCGGQVQASAIRITAFGPTGKGCSRCIVTGVKQKICGRVEAVSCISRHILVLHDVVAVVGKGVRPHERRAYKIEFYAVISVLC